MALDAQKNVLLVQWQMPVLAEQRPGVRSPGVKWVVWTASDELS